MDQHGNLNKFHPEMSSNQKQKRKMNHSPNEKPKGHRTEMTRQKLLFLQNSIMLTTYLQEPLQAHRNTILL